MQRALIQYRDPKNYALVREALEKAGRQDLIGFGKECLIRPYPPHDRDRQKPGGKSFRQEPSSRRGKSDSTPAARGRKAAGRPDSSVRKGSGHSRRRKP